MSDVFISHAVADKDLAKLLVDLLKEAIGVPAASIFCSSLKGHHIPLGQDFNDYIKKEIQQPKLVILLMTTAYMESSFCLMELGAAWAQSSESLPIVVPPVDYDSVTKTLGLKQSWKITDKSGLVDLRATVRKAIANLEERSEHTWEDKRAQWGISLKKIIPKLQSATKVDAAQHKKAITDLADRDAEVERLEDALARAQERNVELEALKDKDEVKALKKQKPDSQALEREFNELIEAVTESRPKAYKSVLKHIISDHYGRAGAIDWYSEREEFNDARKYGLISQEDDSVEWRRGKLKSFRAALREVDTFLESDDGKKWQKQQEAGVPSESDDLEFWEYHLSL